MQIESNGHSLSYGRFDQYIYPLFKKDIDSGKLTKADALELLTCLWIKTLTVQKIRSQAHTLSSAGSPMYQNVTVGGQTVDKKDAVNKLSFVVLQSIAQTRLTQPNFTVRYHANIDKKFMEECIEVMKLGFGMPALNNDEIIIPSFINWGVKEEDAYNHSAIDKASERDVPDILCSALTDACIARGKTIKEGGAVYDFISGLQVGIADMADSLAAIKKLVFEEKKISPAQLWDAILDNFTSPENQRIQEMFISAARLAAFVTAEPLQSARTSVKAWAPWPRPTAAKLVSRSPKVARPRTTPTRTAPLPFSNPLPNFRRKKSPAAFYSIKK